MTLIGSIFTVFLTASLILKPTRARADDTPSPHVVGWVNTFVPGGGELLLGHPWIALGQATLEISSFWIGYSISARSPLTLDGVPEEIPVYSRNVTGRSSLRLTRPTSDITRPLFADWAQELGIKAHFVDVFNAYRSVSTSGVDQTPTLDLYLKPFQRQTLADPWVYAPIALSVVAVVLDYLTTLNAQQVVGRPTLTPNSNYMYTLTYAGVFPFGSAVPEEMFYRGFLQNEVYSVSHTPFVSIPVATAAFALSHQQGIDQVVGAISGFYAGLLTHMNHGQLGPAIAYHFWADVIAGVEAILLLHKGQKNLPPASFYLQLNY